MLVLLFAGCDPRHIITFDGRHVEVDGVALGSIAEACGPDVPCRGVYDRLHDESEQRGVRLTVPAEARWADVATLQYAASVVSIGKADLEIGSVPVAADLAWFDDDGRTRHEVVNVALVVSTDHGTSTLTGLVLPLAIDCDTAYVNEPDHLAACKKSMDASLGIVAGEGRSCLTLGADLGLPILDSGICLVNPRGALLGDPRRSDEPAHLWAPDAATSMQSVESLFGDGVDWHVLVPFDAPAALVGDALEAIHATGTRRPVLVGSTSNPEWPQPWLSGATAPACTVRVTSGKGVESAMKDYWSVDRVPEATGWRPIPAFPSAEGVGVTPPN